MNRPEWFLQVQPENCSPSQVALKMAFCIQIDIGPLVWHLGQAAPGEALGRLSWDLAAHDSASFEVGAPTTAFFLSRYLK